MRDSRVHRPVLRKPQHRAASSRSTLVAGPASAHSLLGPAAFCWRVKGWESRLPGSLANPRLAQACPWPEGCEGGSWPSFQKALYCRLQTVPSGPSRGVTPPFPSHSMGTLGKVCNLIPVFASGKGMAHSAKGVSLSTYATSPAQGTPQGSESHLLPEPARQS